MENALEKLCAIVNRNLMPDKIGSGSLGAADINRFLYVMVEECENIQHYLHKYSIKAKGSDGLSLLITHYQRRMADLSDKLYRYQLSIQDEKIFQLYGSMTDAVDGLLQDIQKTYRKYFNVHCKVPDKEIALYRKDWQRTRAKLGSILKQHGIDKELIDIALQPIDMALNDNTGLVTYYQMALVKELAAELQVFDKVPTDNPRWTVIAILLRVNVNSPVFFDYCTRYIHEIENSEDDLKEKLMAYRALYVKLRCVWCKPYMGLYAENESFLARLEGIVVVQIGFLEKDDRLYKQWRGQFFKKVRGTVKKVLLSFTVQEWGVWLRSDLDCGALQADKLDEAFDILASVLRTDRSEDISAKSAREKSGKLTNESRDKLLKMAKLKYYFIKNYGL